MPTRENFGVGSGVTEEGDPMSGIYRASEQESLSKVLSFKLAKLGLVYAVLLTLVGCASVAEPVAEPVATSAAPTSSSAPVDMNELGSCQVFQELVWLQPVPLLIGKELIEQELDVLYSLGSFEQYSFTIREWMSSYKNLVSGALRDGRDDETFGQWLHRPPMTDTFEDAHLNLAAKCAVIGFVIYDDEHLAWHGHKIPRTQEVDADIVGQLSTCQLDMRAASLEKGGSAAEKKIELTVFSCEGEDEWYQALRLFPYAMGFPDVTGNELEIVCFKYPDGKACRNP